MIDPGGSSQGVIEEGARGGVEVLGRVVGVDDLNAGIEVLVGEVSDPGRTSAIDGHLSEHG